MVLPGLAPTLPVAGRQAGQRRARRGDGMAVQHRVREALNRLVLDGLVRRREQRGFLVASISGDDLAEITRTRSWLEEIALRGSIAHRSQAWEEALVLAHHRLARAPRSLSDSHFEDHPEWEPLHRAFFSPRFDRWLRLALVAAVL